MQPLFYNTRLYLPRFLFSRLGSSLHETSVARAFTDAPSNTVLREAPLFISSDVATTHRQDQIHWPFVYETT